MKFGPLLIQVCVTELLISCYFYILGQFIFWVYFRNNIIIFLLIHNENKRFRCHATVGLNLNTSTLFIELENPVSIKLKCCLKISNMIYISFRLAVLLVYFLFSIRKKSSSAKFKTPVTKQRMCPGISLYRSLLKYYVTL